MIGIPCGQNATVGSGISCIIARESSEPWPIESGIANRRMRQSMPMGNNIFYVFIDFHGLSFDFMAPLSLEEREPMEARPFQK